MTNKLTIFKTTNCSTCAMVFRRLDQKGLPYSVINVEQDEAAAQRLKDAGMLMAPVLAWKGELHTVVDLSRIISELEAQSQEAAA